MWDGDGNNWTTRSLHVFEWNHGSQETSQCAQDGVTLCPQNRVHFLPPNSSEPTHSKPKPPVTNKTKLIKIFVDKLALNCFDSIISNISNRKRPVLRNKLHQIECRKFRDTEVEESMYGGIKSRKSGFNMYNLFTTH